MRTVLFTGAGASKAIGYPLTRELLPRILERLEREQLFENTVGEKKGGQDRKTLEGYIRGLLPGLEILRQSESQLPLITDLFSLVDYSLENNNALPIGSDGVLQDCRNLLVHAIADVLLDDFEEDWDDSDPIQRQQQKTLEALAKWYLNQDSQVSLVTTNYDIGLEYELCNRMQQKGIKRVVDLGFDWRDPGSGDQQFRPEGASLRAFKLHGSLDQLRCPLCGFVYYNEFGTIVHQAFAEESNDENTCHCQTAPRLQVNIVSPSFVRDIRDANLLSVWRSALEALRTASRWVIAGYSLPPEDLAIRSLLIRAYAAAPKKPDVAVVQHGKDALPAYQALFPACTYITGGMEEFLREQSS